MLPRVQPTLARIRLGHTARLLSSTTTEAIVLCSRPEPNTALSESNMQATTAPLPALTPGSVAVRTLYLSVDPFLRCRFNEDTGVDYTQPYHVGRPISSAGIGVVSAVGAGAEAKPGDFLLDPFDSWPWMTDCVFDADRVRGLKRLPAALEAFVPLSYTLGACGQTGVTAWCAVNAEAPDEIRRGSTVVVSGAAGAVGSVACQLAARRGAHVVGICSLKKVHFLRELGVEAVAYDTQSFPDQLSAAVGSSGVDVYIDNVGGGVTGAVVPLMKRGARIVLCGQIDMYDSTETYPPPLPPALQAVADARLLRRDRYLVLNHEAVFDDALRDLIVAAAGESLRVAESRVEGLHAAPAALVEQLKPGGGGRVGKVVVSVNEAPPSLVLAGAGRHFLPPAVRGLLAAQLPL